MYYAFTPTGREIAAPNAGLLLNICAVFAWNPASPINYRMEISEQRRRRPRLGFIPSEFVSDDIPESEWKDCQRASGDALCECGTKLDEHYQPIRLTCPTIVEDCTGRWLKL